MNQAVSVSELTRTIQVVLEQSLGTVAVSGEISNFKEHTSGHRYFTLKDAGAQIQCVMWKSRALSFRPADGMKVVARGRITIYAPRGNYQLDCTSMQPLGIGDLQMAFEELKRRLFEEGLFSAEYKQPLPQFPSKIGVVTSQTGAAIRDILSTLARRMPGCEVVLRPAQVQGADAAPDIVRAISELNRTNCDLIIVGRGGGSIEDLWAFNTEEVARAIFRSHIPIISAVGHEIDITIADYVADARAATPTAAAEIAVRDYRELLGGLDGVQAHITRIVQQRMAATEKQIQTLAAHPAFRLPLNHVRQNQQELDYMETSLHRAVRRSLAEAQRKAASAEALLASVHPLSPLRRGYAILQSGGEVIAPNRSLRDLATIDIIRNTETAEAVISAVRDHPSLTEKSNGKSTKEQGDL